jgi:DNA polymerase I-like protein with 3'-5' exonuclease and polymerase domains
MDHKMPSFTIKKWDSIVTNFYNKYEGLKEWQINNVREVNRTGILRIPSGRYFAFRKYKGDYNARHIKNYPVQGFAFDIVALSMVIIDAQMHRGGFRSLSVAQVHDEIVFDNKKEEQNQLGRLCIDTFEGLPSYIKQFWGFDVNVPFTGEVSIGDNYEIMKKIDV